VFTTFPKNIYAIQMV